MAARHGFAVRVLILLAMSVFSVECGVRLDGESNVTNTSGIHIRVKSPGSISTPCRLTLSEPSIVEVINGFFNSGTKLLRFNIQIDGDTGSSMNPETVSLYEPTSWILTNSAAGTSLLLLKDYFNEMSLNTLGYGTENVNVNLHQTPMDCLASNTTGVELEVTLREGILDSFGSAEYRLSSGIRACNRHVENTTFNMGRLVYRCCEEQLDGSVNCHEVTETIWLTILFNAIHFLQLLVILFSPLLIPQSAFRHSTSFIDYVYKPQHRPLSFNVQRLNSASNTGGQGYVEVKQHWFTMMKEFQECGWTLVPGKIYTLNVSQVNLRVKASKIIPEGYVPVGVVAFLRKFLFRCGLRNDIPATAKCCNTNMLKQCNCTSTMPWYRCGVYLGSAAMPFMVLLPWLLRVWFYYSIEDSVICRKREAMISRQLILGSTGSLTTDLSPLSTVFMVTYILVPVEAVLYTLVPRNVKRKLKFTVKQCFRDMRASSASTMCARLTAYLCLPFVRFGAVGCIFLPLLLCVLWPILLLIFTVTTLPIFNVSLRMIINCLYYILKVVYPHSLTFLQPNEENNGWFKKVSKVFDDMFGKVLVDDIEKVPRRRNKLLHAVSLAACLITMWLMLLIVAECISFYVECFVYTLTGIILNSSKVMKHLTLVLVIGYYGYDCFSSVYSVYASFNRVVNTAIQKAVGDDIKPVALMSAEEQPNSAFTVNRLDTKLHLTQGTYGFFKCNVDSLLLFLNREDVPFIPRKFLMHVASKSHFACPRKPHVLYFRALLDFLSILFFLMFVIIVIFAFGQANNVSSANQSLAALGGSFLPLVFRKFLFKSHDGPALDTSNIAWTTMFESAIKECKCLWDVEDIIIHSRDEWGDHTDREDVNDTNAATGDENDAVAEEVVHRNDDPGEGVGLLQIMEANSVGVDLKFKLEKVGNDDVIMRLFVREEAESRDEETSPRNVHIADTKV